MVFDKNALDHPGRRAEIKIQACTVGVKIGKTKRLEARASKYGPTEFGDSKYGPASLFFFAIIINVADRHTGLLFLLDLVNQAFGFPRETSPLVKEIEFFPQGEDKVRSLIQAMKEAAKELDGEIHFLHSEEEIIDESRELWKQI